MNRRGITVIDVIIVLGVLTMAAGALLPVIAAGRRQAQILSCAGNLEAINHALEQYLKEHGGKYPSGPLAGGQELSGSNLLGVTGNSQWPNPVALTPTADRPLNRYFSDNLPVISRVARCPMDAGDSYQAQGRTLFEAVGCSYVYPWRPADQEARGNKVVVSGIWSIQGHHRSEITYPERKLILADTIILANRSATDPYNHWHNSREPLEANILFADGHVANLPRKTGDDALPSDPAPVSSTELELLARNARYY